MEPFQQNVQIVPNANSESQILQAGEKQVNIPEANQTLTKMTKDQLKTKLIRKMSKKNKNFHTQGSAQKFKTYLKESVREEVNSDFQCPICLDMMMDPVPTLCGHTFCYRCLEQALIHKPVCPKCRTFIRTKEYPISQNFLNLTSHLWKLSSEKTTYENRINSNSEWKKRRFINADELKVNQYIDVRDTEYIWCQGTIRKLFYERGKLNEILIHYTSWNKIYDQMIRVDSQRLAPANFFTERNDIPKYTLSQEDDNLRGRIQYQNQREQSFTFPSDHNGQEIVEQIPSFVFSLNGLPSFRSIGNSQIQTYPNLNNLNPSELITFQFGNPSERNPSNEEPSLILLDVLEDISDENQERNQDQNPQQQRNDQLQ